MLTTRLTTTNKGILSSSSIPDILRPLIERRTNNNRVFGKLEIIAPQIADVSTATATTATPRRIIAGFLLDTSGSMQGRKIQHAINTIKQLAEILLSERDGKTVQSQPIHSWIYVITFNSDAELVIPFQEITAESLPIILAQLDQIRTTGSTNYERAFKKQTEVIADIIRGLRPPTAVSSSAKAERCERSVAATLDNPGRGASPETTGSYHLIRFFETDGEITDGMRSTEILYKMMRDTGDDATATATAPLTFEDYVLGYGTDVDINCLEMLASPYQRSEYLLNRSHANRKPQYTDAYNCSSLITIIKPDDIGWQMGELLFKVIMRYGYKVQVTISATDAVGERTPPPIELFEYQSHQWSNTTTLHSIIHGERKALYIQYTPPSDTATTAAILVKVQYSNQFTGSTYTYEFEHTITLSPTTDATISVPDLPTILGMIQIEIFKQFREIEAVSRFDKDTIVREAYKTLRMLKSLDTITADNAVTDNQSSEAATLRSHRSAFAELDTAVGGRTPQHENLITDVKVIIGLTTIQNKKEQDMILHARRICSAEQDVFNTGATFSRKYVDGEEDYEEEAAKVIKAHQAAAAEGEQQPRDGVPNEEEDFEPADDGLPSRIPTVLDTPYSQQPYGYGDCGHGQYKKNQCDGSLLRTLCARIAMAKKRKEDLTIEQLYDQVNCYGSAAGYSRGGGYPAHHDDFDLYGHADNTFSSTPMNDDYTQRRMGMMRQMSSASASASASASQSQTSP